MGVWDTALPKIVHEHKTNSSNFLQMPTISRCLHPNQHSTGKLYLDALSSDYAITDPAYGNPYVDKNNISSVSAQQLYYVDQIKKYFGHTKFDHILDIGGGYGNGCRIWKEHGHAGSYTICDFPEMHIIQKDYISKVSSIENVKFLDITNCYESNDNSLMQATFSINEMPLSTRAHIEPNYKKFKYIFISHNRVFDDIDNIKYFSNLKENLEDEYDVSHFACKIYKLAWFFIAQRKQK
jgi:hypothetical protein